MEATFPDGKPPMLWCPVLAHYNTDGSLDTKRMKAHQSWLVKNGVNGFLVPGSTGDAWQMSQDEKLDFMKVCREIAADIPGEGPYLLGGALEATEAETLQVMDKMTAQAGKDIFGFCVCPPRGVPDEAKMEAALSKFLEKGKFIAVYQLPQVCEVTMPVDLLRRLADKYQSFLFFKDSSGEDATALSGVILDGVFMVRGAEGLYAEWLANPIPSGYHGFLLSTANVYPEQLSALVDKIAAGANGGDLKGALDISTRLTRATNKAFSLVTGDLAAGIGGNAFTNSAKCVDFWMAHGSNALRQKAPLPLLKSGETLPKEMVKQIGATLRKEKLMPTKGYWA
jgi:dihydrodipicolinate synthase/N-acetylneuraminate lyase